MLARRPLRLGALLIVVIGLLLYLRDPPWLIQVESGFRDWEMAEDGVRFRWTGGHASFFVASTVSSVSIPIRTAFATSSGLPITVTISVDDRPAQRILITDANWHDVKLDLPARASRRVRRIDIRVDRTRTGNRGVQVAAVLVRRR